MMNKIIEEIVICETCKGTGFKPGTENECTNCLGKGRMLRQTQITESPIDDENLKRKSVYG